MDIRMFRKLSLAVFVFFLILTGSLAGVAEDKGLLGDIDRLSSLDVNSNRSLADSIAVRIKANPSAITAQLLAAMAHARTDEAKLNAYLWALGVAADTGAVDTVIAIAEATESEPIHYRCMSALAVMGGERAGQFLTAKFTEATDKEKRFELLNLLAEMQYMPALSSAVEVLEVDPQTEYWRPIFIFGKMGDSALPMLFEKISDSSRNVRINAVNLIGQWLIPVESARILSDRYWQEEDPEIRMLILSSLERMVTDADTLKALMKEVNSKEQNKDLKRFAHEAGESVSRMKHIADSIFNVKTFSAAAFREQYDLIYNSAGKEGDYKVLSRVSSVDDESRLKELRCRILQRNSDECFYDYQLINDIILINRLVAHRK